MNKEYQSIQPLFEAYDKASDEATKCFIKSIKARQNGKTAIANYLDKSDYPKLAKRSRSLLDIFSNALDRL